MRGVRVVGRQRLCRIIVSVTLGRLRRMGLVVRLLASVLDELRRVRGPHIVSCQHLRWCSLVHMSVARGRLRTVRFVVVVLPTVLQELRRMRGVGIVCRQHALFLRLCSVVRVSRRWINLLAQLLVSVL